MHCLDVRDERLAAVAVRGRLFERLGLLPFLAPLGLEPLERRLVDRVEAPRAAAGREAVGRAVAQDEHHQPLVVAAAGGDEIAVVVDRLLDAVERAVHRAVLDPAHAEIERGVPRGAEFGACRVAAHCVGAAVAAPDPAQRGGDAAGLGQRGDKRALDFGLPAVAAVLEARDGGEARDERGCGGGGVRVWGRHGGLGVRRRETGGPGIGGGL